MNVRAGLARLWPFRRPADPAAVQTFRIQGRPEVHRVEAGTPLADARERGAVVLFETNDPGRYALGEARDADGKLVAIIVGWTSYGLGHVAGADGAVYEKRRAAAWGWPVDARQGEDDGGQGAGGTDTTDRPTHEGARRRPRVRPPAGGDGGNGGAGAEGDGRARRKGRGATGTGAASDVAAAPVDGGMKS